MTGRERLAKALAHEPADRVPIDLGSTATSGAHVSVIHQLRQALGLTEQRVRVVEPYQMLGEVSDDLRDALGIDTVGLGLTRTLFGFKNEGWKPWVTFDGTPVLVPGKFNTQPAADGALYQYPEGDRTVPPSGKMPAGGFYHDAIVRQPPLDEANLRVEDNLAEFGAIQDDDLEHLRRTADFLYDTTGYALVGTFGGTSFGDIALVPAPWLKNPKGIRDIEEWYISTVSRRDHLMAIFDRQCEIAIANLELVRQAVGSRLSAVFVSGTDFGTQNAPFLSADTYREVYQPFHRRVNGWIHRQTSWKTFIHSCGAVEPLIDDFIAAGFDILNPVQCSAAGMEPARLKARYGDRLVFWGGGVDTQRVLPFGSRAEVVAQVRERVRTFGAGGGFVFNPIHNLQANTPVGNVVAMFKTAARTRPGR